MYAVDVDRLAKIYDETKKPFYNFFWVKSKSYYKSDKYIHKNIIKGIKLINKIVIYNII
jgi:hypothetical protein